MVISKEGDGALQAGMVAGGIRWWDPWVEKQNKTKGIRSKEEHQLLAQSSQTMLGRLMNRDIPYRQLDRQSSNGEGVAEEELSQKIMLYDSQSEVMYYVRLKHYFNVMLD